MQGSERNKVLAMRLGEKYEGVEGEEVMEEDITGTVMAGVVTREVVEGMELVATEAVVARVEGDVTAVAAARLEAW